MAKTFGAIKSAVAVSGRPNVKSSASFCFVASGFPSLFLCTLAGVAVLSTPLATTAQRVLQFDCWVAGDSHWRAQRLAFVGKQAAESL